VLETPKTRNRLEESSRPVWIESPKEWVQRLGGGLIDKVWRKCQ
jgi:hypothetical protein